MKSFRVLCCVLSVLFVGFSVGLAAPNEPKANQMELDKVLQFERDWCRAYLHGDTDFLQKYVLDDFPLTNSNREISTKAGKIKDLKSGAAKYEVFENREMKPRIYGDTAVSTGWTRVKGTIEGKPYETMWPLPTPSCGSAASGTVRPATPANRNNNFFRASGPSATQEDRR